MYRRAVAFAFAIVINCAALAQEPEAPVDAFIPEWPNRMPNGMMVSSVHYPSSAVDRRRSGEARLCCPVDE